MIQRDPFHHPILFPKRSPINTSSFPLYWLVSRYPYNGVFIAPTKLGSIIPHRPLSNLLDFWVEWLLFSLAKYPQKGPPAFWQLYLPGNDHMITYYQGKGTFWVDDILAVVPVIGGPCDRFLEGVNPGWLRLHDSHFYGPGPHPKVIHQDIRKKKNIPPHPSLQKDLTFPGW